MDIKVSTNFSLVGAFYAVGAGQGEGVLTNPTAGKCEIVDSAGVKIGGSPFALGAVAGGHAGIYTTGALNLAPVGYYSYTFYDQQDPTPTIAHVSGFFHIINNPNDDLDTEIDTLTTNLATANTALTDIKGASFATGTDSLKILSDQIDLIMGSGFATGTDSLKILSDVLDAIEGAGFSTTTDSLKVLRDVLDTIGTPPSASTVAAAVWNAVAASFVTLGTFGGIVSRVKGPGAGATQLTKDTGGSNTLRPEVSGVAQVGVNIDAFLTSDYVAGNTTSAYLKGRGLSDASGDFKILLDTGAYTLLYYRLRSGANSGLTPTTTTVTVS